MYDETYWDDVANRYELLYNTKWDQYEDNVLGIRLLKIMERFENPRILDIGCGHGLAFRLISAGKRKFEYIGLDISNRMLDFFRQAEPSISLVNGSGDDMANYFSPNSFDLIIAVNAAASFPKNTISMLKAAHQLLRRGGEIYLSFLNRVSLRRIVKLQIGSSERYRTRGDEHNSRSVGANVFSASEISVLCSSLGFQSVSTCHQSVLGGVWESDISIHIDKALTKLAPFWGHTLYVNAKKGNW